MWIMNDAIKLTAIHVGGYEPVNDVLQKLVILCFYTARWYSEAVISDVKCGCPLGIGCFEFIQPN